MRNALGLMLASVSDGGCDHRRLVLDLLAARRRGPPSNRRRPQGRAVAGAAAKRAKDDVEITASLSKPAPAPRPFPAAQPARYGGLRQSRLRSASAASVVIDTTGRPGFGFLQYKQFDFLTDKEVVLTFDDGPWPTDACVLKALADECTKGPVLPVGKHTTVSSGNLKQVFPCRPHHRLAHLVARPSRRQEDDGAQVRKRSRRVLAP
jgi:hypothetical protein